MANPLKILTVLTASEAAQFKKAVEVEAGGLKVTAGDTNVQALYATNLSASGTAQVAGAATLASTLNVAGAATFSSPVTASYITNLHNIKSDGVLEISGCVWVNQDVTITGTLGSVGTIVAYAGLNANSQKIEMLANGVNPSDAANYGQLSAVATTASANLTSVSGALKSYVDAKNLLQDLTSSAFSSSIKSYVDTRDAAVSGALKTYVDAQDTALSGAVKTYVDAQDTALSGAVKTYVDAQDTALSSSMKSYVDAQGTSLSGSVSSSIAAEAAARAAEDLTFLKLDGSRAMSGSLNMGGQDIVSAKSGSFSADVTVGGKLTVTGDFQVNGALTYVNSTNLDVTDKLITIAKGATNAAAADGGGIELEGASASLKYVASGDKWVANKSFQVDSDLFISGATAFSYIPVSRVDGKYDVDAAIQALDVAVSGAVAAGSGDLVTLKNNYDALRQVVTGTLSSGTALLTLAGTQFAASQIDNLALDVMIDADNTGYTNDLVAIKMYVDGAAVKVQIDAPAAASAKYRLIVVNEADGKL